MNKIAVYTANFGGYDKFLPPVAVDYNFDYFMFTDDISFEDKYYRKILCQRDILPNEKARYYKIIQGYSLLSRMGYETIVWHDANMSPIGNIMELIESMEMDFMLMKHPTRDCIYEEYSACCLSFPNSKGHVPTMNRQVQKYADEGYPEHNGMVATGVMIRKVNKSVNKFCLDWWDEVHRYSKRDQLSFNYIAWKKKYKFEMIPFNDTLTFYFNYKKHLEKC